MDNGVNIAFVVDMYGEDVFTGATVVMDSDFLIKEYEVTGNLYIYPEFRNKGIDKFMDYTGQDWEIVEDPDNKMMHLMVKTIRDCGYVEIDDSGYYARNYAD